MWDIHWEMIIFFEYRRSSDYCGGSFKSHFFGNSFFLYDFGLHGNTNQYIVLSPVGISARGPYNFGGVGADYTYSATASDQPLIINSNHIFSDQNQLYVNGEWWRVPLFHRFRKLPLRNCRRSDQNNRISTGNNWGTGEKL